MTQQTSLNAYMRRSAELQLQQAGLELVNHVRTCINEENFRRCFKGDFVDQLYVRIQTKSRRQIMPTLKRLLDGMSLSQQRILIAEILSPHLKNGDMPPFRVIEEPTSRGYEQHIRLEYDFSL